MAAYGACSGCLNPNATLKLMPLEYADAICLSPLLVFAAGKAVSATSDVLGLKSLDLHAAAGLLAFFPA